MNLAVLFPGSIWLYLAVFVAASAAGATGGYIARGVIDAPAMARQETATAKAEAATQTCIAQHETGRANANAKVVTDLQNSVRDLQGTITTLEAQRHARDTATTKFLEALANAPKTSICGGSPSERAYRDSVHTSIPAVSP